MVTILAHANRPLVRAVGAGPLAGGPHHLLSEALGDRGCGGRGNASGPTRILEPKHNEEVTPSAGNRCQRARTARTNPGGLLRPIYLGNQRGIHRRHEAKALSTPPPLMAAGGSCPSDDTLDVLSNVAAWYR